MSDERNGWKELCRQFRQRTESDIQKGEDRTDDLEERVRVLEQLGAVSAIKIAGIISVCVIIISVALKFLFDWLSKL